MNIDWLFERLADYKEDKAICWRERQYNYTQLLDGINKWNGILADYRISPGACVAVHGDFSPDMTMLIVALIANRNVIVPLTTSVDLKEDRALKISCANYLIEFHDDDSWEIQPCDNPGTHPLLSNLKESGDSGLILFTSGSAGESKASLHSFPQILNRLRKQRSHKKYRTLTFLLLDHIGGINTLFYTLLNGGTIVTVPKRTADSICETIQRYKVQLLPTTPTFLNMLLIAEANTHYDLSSLELITYGTEPMSKATLKALLDIFPQVKVKQTYGLTEVGILPTKTESSDSLWIKLGGEGYETKVVDGILWVRAESSMLGYLNAPSPFDEEGWLNTGDEVEVKNGSIHILGRNSDIINVGGEKVYPTEVENEIAQIDNIKNVTVEGRPNPVTGSIVVACVELFQSGDQDALNRRIREYCRDRLEQYKIPAYIEIASINLIGERFKKVRNTKTPFPVNN